MNPFSLMKSAAELIVSAGAAAVVGNAIKASIPANAKTLNKVSITIGGFVLSGMVGEAAAKYATANLDNAAEQFRKVKEVVTDSSTEQSEA